MVGFISRVETMACSEEDVMTLAAINHWLREEAISLLLEIAALREHMKAQTSLVVLPQPFEDR